MNTLLSRISIRWLGVLPLIFFFAQAVHYWRISQLGHLLWPCNIGNLILALGLLFEKPVVVRVAAILMIPGVVVWFIYVVLPWGVFLTSMLIHVGGLVVSLVALKRYRMDRTSWRYAFGWYLAIQLISRFVTPPDLNVNLAHAIAPGWEHAFGSYWSFWLVLTAVSAVVLWVTGMLLWSIWRPDAAQNLATGEL